MLFVEHFPPCMKRLVLLVDGGGVLFQLLKVRSELFQVLSVTGRAELRAMELLELLHQFGMR